MVIAQLLLSLPLVVGFSLASIQSVNPRLIGQMWAMGANRWQVLWLLVRETRLGLLAAVMAGFGRRSRRSARRCRLAATLSARLVS